MKRNVLQLVIEFIFRYIWIFCAVLIILEIVSTVSTGGILMKQSTQGILKSVSDEISGRVDGVLRLLKGLSNDQRINDLSVPLYDRAILTRPYEESYDLFMLALTDEDVNVISSDETEPPKENFSLAHRDYMQRLYTTGEYQITDAFPAGSDGVTMNYTIAVPILKNGTVKGSVFGAIYFEDIENSLTRDIRSGSNFYLTGRENTIMVGGDTASYGESFESIAEKNWFIGIEPKVIDQLQRDGIPGDCWLWNEDGLCYVTFQRVEPTEWTLIYEVQFTSIIQSLLPTMLVKIFFYILLCALISLFGKRYLKRHLSSVNHLLDKVTVMQRELFQSEQPDYDNLLELTQKGLTDQLTGLATRAVLFKKINQILGSPSAAGTLMFVDLDDLKRINDNFGHEAGDCALLHFAQTLKRYESQYSGIAARYGGDEFVLVLDDVLEKDADAVAEELCVALNTELTVKERKLTVHGSIGVAFYPDQGTKLEELICKADLALYSAKHEGKNRCAFYRDIES